MSTVTGADELLPGMVIKNPWSTDSILLVVSEEDSKLCTKYNNSVFFRHLNGDGRDSHVSKTLCKTRTFELVFGNPEV